MADQTQIWIFAAAVLVFWFIIYFIDKKIQLEKYGLKITPFFLKYESQKFKELLYKAVSRGKTFWLVFSNLSVALGAGILIFALYFLSDNLARFLIAAFGFVGPDGMEGATPVVPIIPGFTIQLYWLPYLVCAIVVAAVIHEIAHGIVALNEGINLKSAGAFLLAIFPGGFVETAEEEMKKSNVISKLRIVSAGSSINALVGLLVFLLLFTLFAQTPAGIVIIEMSDQGPLERAGFQRWDILYEISGTAVKSFEELGGLMSKVRPGQILILGSSRGGIEINAAADPNNASRAIIGIISPALLYYPSRLNLGYYLDVQLYLTLNWLFTILVNLAIFNMLPIPFLDGDQYIGLVLQRFKGKGDSFRKFLNVLSIFLIAANMILSLGGGLLPF